MPIKISMTVPDDDLALIDQFSGGNRTAFMVGAAVDRARLLRRQAIDADIARCIESDDLVELVAELDPMAGDGLEDSVGAGHR